MNLKKKKYIRLNFAIGSKYLSPSISRVQISLQKLSLKNVEILPFSQKFDVLSHLSSSPLDLKASIVIVSIFFYSIQLHWRNLIASKKLLLV